MKGAAGVVLCSMIRLDLQPIAPRCPSASGPAIRYRPNTTVESAAKVRVPSISLMEVIGAAPESRSSEPIETDLSNHRLCPPASLRAMNVSVLA
jgi:hypothetical protein